MNSLRLHSSRSDLVLEFADVDGDGFRVSVIAHDHSATRRVWAHTDAAGLGRLFADAAREWSGWNGTKAWESLEGELRLELSTDRLGHVRLRVRIRSDPGGADQWQLDAELELDAGELDAIARQAHRLWCCA